MGWIENDWALPDEERRARGQCVGILRTRLRALPSLISTSRIASADSLTLGAQHDDFGSIEASMQTEFRL